MATTPAPDDDVEKSLTRIMSQQSPLMKQARTQGLQSAQTAGLGQSTKGIQAAQAAAYQAALPIASQQAQQAHQKGMQGAQFGHETEIQSRGFQHASSQADLDRAQQTKMANLTGYLDRLATQEQLAIMQPHEANMKALDRQMQERLASMEISAQDKERALSAMTQFNNAYAGAYAQIAQNENIPADARAYFLNRMNEIRDHNQNLTTSLYRYAVPW